MAVLRILEKSALFFFCPLSDPDPVCLVGVCVECGLLQWAGECGPLVQTVQEGEANRERGDRPPDDSQGIRQASKHATSQQIAH